VGSPLSLMVWCRKNAPPGRLWLADNSQPAQRLGHLPKDAPRRVGNYLATLQRPAGEKQTQGTLSPLKSESPLPEYRKPMPEGFPPGSGRVGKGPGTKAARLPGEDDKEEV
jgi:hypothetical protein